MTVTTVPDQDDGQRILVQPLYPNPYSLAWWQTQTITNVPQENLGWLVAQGWQITSISYDTTTTPQTPYYAMSRDSIKNWEVLQALLDSYTEANNTALANNTFRYNDIVDNWGTLIDTSYEHFDEQTALQNSYTTTFNSTLNEYVSEVDSLIDESQAQLENFEPDFTFHENESPTYLDNLGTTELARINEEFAASLSAQLQQLTDRGLYSAAIAADIKARNTRDRDEQVQLLNDRLNREKLENEHRLYEQKVNMRDRVQAGTTRVIADKTNLNNTHLAALTATNEACLRLMQYQLDERNKLFVGLYGFVERRDDVAPSFESMVQIATGLGDAGGGWVTP